jgi:hypothetical protein
MGRIPVDLITADHITAGLPTVDTRDQLQWKSVIALTTLAVPGTTPAARIMFGDAAIGAGGMVSACGSTASTWCEDTDSTIRRSAEQSPSAPDGNVQLLPGSPTRTARSCGN